jgi:hypothetical protein
LICNRYVSTGFEGDVSLVGGLIVLVVSVACVGVLAGMVFVGTAVVEGEEVADVGVVAAVVVVVVGGAVVDVRVLK